MAQIVSLSPRKSMTRYMAKHLHGCTKAPWVSARATMLGLGVAVVLFATSARAQNGQAPRSAASAAESPASAPRYLANDLERAFSFMDSKHDGKISREEASGFRGVAKHFDEADTNHDNALSREELDKAMNYVKPQ